MDKTIKEQLIAEFLHHKSSDSIKTNKLIIKFEKELNKSPDAEVTLFMYALKVQKSRDDNKSFKESCAIATPIFEQIESTVTWGYHELLALSFVIGYSADFDKTVSFYKKAQDVLSDKKYVDNPEFVAMGLSMTGNFTLRILRAKYFDKDVSDDTLKPLFQESYNSLMEVFSDTQLSHKYILEVRRGIFENNMALVDSGLSKLLELTDKKRYASAVAEIVECLANMNELLSKPLQDFFIGHQAKKRRIELKLSVFDVAVALDTDQSTISAIERGDNGVSTHRLSQLAKVLFVREQYFFGDDTKKLDITDPFIVAMQANIHDATEEEKEFILSFTKQLLSLKNPKRGKRGNATAKKLEN
ncbi:MAG: helix-turn-helix domain-containing protein [Defluviitaleaceae bacterium]|nr:helix-turn-helix domain-containing protein [Defluviitaleaceae bacterium]